MNPVDLVSTRLYNQHRVKDGGAYYSGPIDCLKKSAKAEGVLSLWKVEGCALVVRLPFLGNCRKLFSPRPSYHGNICYVGFAEAKG